MSVPELREIDTAPPAAKSSESVMATLRRFVRPRAKREVQCELCGAAMAHEHDHLLEPESRKILCACRACGILFSNSQSGRYRLVQPHADTLADFQMTDEQWESLLIPINLAFFFHSTPAARVVAVYPSPAGATESLLDLESWKDLAANNPVLNDLQSDVEALLVNRVGPTRQYYRISIDRCYELVGLIRIHWRGLSGGNEVWQKIQEFFDSFKTSAGEAIHA